MKIRETRTTMGIREVEVYDVRFKSFRNFANDFLRGWKYNVQDTHHEIISAKTDNETFMTIKLLDGEGCVDTITIKRVLKKNVVDLVKVSDDD